MPQSQPALVPPDTLRWARESIGLPLDEAAEKIRISVQRLERAEEGKSHLTLRQAEKAANVYRRPLAALFVTKPLEEEQPEALFRRLPGAPSLPWTYEMHTLARRIRERQAAAAEIYDLLEEEPPWLSYQIGASEDAAELGAWTRSVLGVEVSEQRSWRDRSGYLPLRAWIQSVERQGVLVMQDGSMSVQHMRGFVALHSTVPTIILNTNDDPRARAFTLLHEYGHLLSARIDRTPESGIEPWLDEFASSLLMPRQDIVRDYRDTSGPILGRIDELALRYGVTPKAAAVRVARLHLAPQTTVEKVISDIEERSATAGERSQGGNYYLNIISRLGPGFIDLVFSALDIQIISYPEASSLLGVKVNNFTKLRENVIRRASS